MQFARAGVSDGPRQRPKALPTAVDYRSPQNSVDEPAFCTDRIWLTV